MQLLAKRTEELRAESGKKPVLRIVGGTSFVPGEVAEPRERLLSRIRDFARMYWLAWLVRQEAAHLGKTLEEFTDDELGDLMHKMEKGRDCRNEDVSFDDAGLIRGSLGAELGY